MIISGLDNEEYHKKKALSKSGLDLIAESPMHYKAGFRSIKYDTARLGTVIHAYILEGATGCVVAPDIKRQSKVDKERWRDWFLENGADIDTSKSAATWHEEFQKQTGKSIVTAKEEGEVKQMLDSVANNEDARELLTSGEPEVSIFNEYNGVEIRTRPDWLIKQSHTIVDVKSTMSASERLFRSSVAKQRYHVQDAFYSLNHHIEFGEWPRFVFIAVQKTSPFMCVVYELDDEAKQNGAWLMDRDIDTYKRCLESGVWPGYPNNFNLSIPIYEPETFTYDVGDEVISA